MQLANLDLNLLVALDALLSCRSVTLAARRLGRTQSALSQSLARLRELLDDPLLVRTGRGMVPSAKAEAMAPDLRRLIAEIEALLSREAAFDPASSTRGFRLACPDLMAPFLAGLVCALAAEAPGVTLKVERQPPEPVAEALAAPDAPLGLMPSPPPAPALKLRALGLVSWGILLRRDHPLVTRPGADWLSFPHLVVETGTGTPNRVAEGIAARGLRRKVGLTLPSFLMVPDVLAHTELLHIAPRELVGPLLDRYGLTLLPLPAPLPPIPVAAVWHERHHADPGHRWLRERVASALSRVLGGVSGGARWGQTGSPEPDGRDDDGEHLFG